MTSHATTARLTGTGSASEREKDDFYATPSPCTFALLKAEPITGPIWEPACGQGHISKVLEASGHEVISTDLVDRGFGISRVDFLMEPNLLAPTIITNPPFGISTEFVEHALQLGCRKLCILHKLQFLAGAGRSRIIDHGFENFGAGLARVHVFTNRVSLWKDGTPTTGGMLSFAWYIWERGHRTPPIINRIVV